MEEEFVPLSECLCMCENEDRTPKTKKDRMIDAIQIVLVGIVATTFAALAAIGLISVYLAIVLNS